jgi:hypothetical protein
MRHRGHREIGSIGLDGRLPLGPMPPMRFFRSVPALGPSGNAVPVKILRFSLSKCARFGTISPNPAAGLMQIVELWIENFRGIRTARVRFGQHTIFVGPNNCGKTTMIEALALLFGRDRMVRPLTEHDFFGGDPQPADRIRLVATIIGFEGDDPAEHSEWFRDDRGVPKWWNPTAGIVSATRDDPSWPLACQIGFCARFDRSELEVETVRYFHDDDTIGDLFLDEAHIRVSGRLIRDIGFFLVPASRTWDRVVLTRAYSAALVICSIDSRTVPRVESWLGTIGRSEEGRITEVLHN